MSDQPRYTPEQFEAIADYLKGRDWSALLVDRHGSEMSSDRILAAMLHQAAEQARERDHLSLWAEALAAECATLRVDRDRLARVVREMRAWLTARTCNWPRHNYPVEALAELDRLEAMKP